MDPKGQTIRPSIYDFIEVIAIITWIAIVFGIVAGIASWIYSAFFWIVSFSMNDNRDDRPLVDMKLPLMGLAGSGLACALASGVLFAEFFNRGTVKPSATAAGIFAIASVLAFGFLGLITKQK